MSCFTDFITVTGTCSDGTSTSGYSLKDVGITLSELDEVVTKDYTNGKALGDAKIDFARKLINNRVLGHFSDKFNTNSIIDGQRIGYPQDNMGIVTGTAGKFKGLEFEICNNDSFVNVYISELSLFLNYSGVVAVEVWDLKQNKLLDTLSITAVAGEIVTSYVNKTYTSDRKELDLAFIYDSDGVDAYKCDIKGVGGCRTCGETTGGTYINPYVKAKGVMIDDADVRTKTNLENNSYTSGIMVQFNINCNYDAWLCTIKDHLALPILYKSAESIMEFSLHTSDRNNSRTIIDVEKNEGRMSFYNNKFNETMDSVLKHIKLPKDSKCFSCKQMSKTVTMLP